MLMRLSCLDTLYKYEAQQANNSKESVSSRGCIYVQLILGP